MSDQHITRDLLAEIYRGERSPADLVPVVVAHLFDLCPQCRDALEDWRGEALGAGSSPRAYGSVIESVAAKTAATAERVMICEEQAPELAEELLALPVEERAATVRGAPQRYCGPELAELLLSASRRHVLASPKEARDLAALARSVLQHASATPTVIEIYSRAVAHLANSYRVLGEIQFAGEVFEHARFLLKSVGDRDPLVAAELDSLEGSLRRDQRRLDEAAVLFARAALELEAIAENNEAARNLIALSMVHRERNELTEGIEQASNALSLLDADEAPRLYLMARHNLAYLLCESGAYQEARTVIAESQDLYRRYPDPWVQLRLLWLEGNLARGEEKPDIAAEALLAVRDGFLREGFGYDAALVSLDLATLYAEQRRMSELKQLAQEIYRVFEAQDIHREAAAALMLFQDAVRAEQVSLRWLRDLSLYLEAARFNPTLIFLQPS